jgi:hypothetical protein
MQNSALFLVGKALRQPLSKRGYATQETRGFNEDSDQSRKEGDMQSPVPTQNHQGEHVVSFLTWLV